MDKSRLQAANALADYIAEHTEIFELKGHNPGSVVTVCLDSDTIAAVMNRIARDAPHPPATIAVYCPKNGKLEILSMGLAKVSDPALVTPVGSAATIGMLADDLRNRGGSSEFRLTNGWYETQMACNLGQTNHGGRCVYREEGRSPGAKKAPPDRSCVVPQ